MTPIRPMLACPSSGASNRTPITPESLRDYAFDVKLDGTRAIATWDGTRLWLHNRNGVDVTAKYPDLVEPFEALYAGCAPITLDGEIVAADGRFETALTRDKQASAAGIARAVKTMPVTFVAFDRPDLAHEPWRARRAILDTDALPIGWTRTAWSPTPDYLAVVRANGGEGVIAKRLSSRYEFGGRSRSWIKFKNLHRVSCLVSGYAPGEGSRAAFGAMTLALIAGGQIVPCGRVGTGMSVRDLADLKARLDAHELLVVEIECLGVTSGRTLRMPVYKGIRTDVALTSCTADQLDTIPKA